MLVCNDPEGADALLQTLPPQEPVEPERLEPMRRRGSARDLRKSVAYRDAQETLGALARQARREDPAAKHPRSP